MKNRHQMTSSLLGNAVSKFLIYDSENKRLVQRVDELREQSNSFQTRLEAITTDLADMTEKYKVEHDEVLKLQQRITTLIVSEKKLYNCFILRRNQQVTLQM
jgi:predicted nuclease with TOPRIM domain